ncbi:class I SAM-dependent methyltransferase [Phenylobacterium sp.]|uniref:class I SAM-dependent methyltransferase n=1 Tax=Phenylobacterium sp. TaxID=1871053 RepID=UPI00391D09C7
MSGALPHYTGEGGAAYHARREVGRSDIAQQGRAAYFQGLTMPTDVVLDFGCATGGVLSRLPGATRIGVEVNPVAAAEARGVLDRVVASLDDIADASVDAVISFHALEHVPEPSRILGGVFRVLKPGGRFRLIVPYDNILLNPSHRAWRPGDPDLHLFGWTPLAFGNLLTVAGFEVEEVRVTHWANVGRLSRLLAPVGLGGAVQWLKAIGLGHLQVVATGRRPAA